MLRCGRRTGAQPAEAAAHQLRSPPSRHVARKGHRPRFRIDREHCADDALFRVVRIRDAQGKQQARALARQQREVAAGLEEAADRDNTGRAEAMAREARQLAQAMESAAVDPSVLERQQRLFRKMLDAGLSLENEDEREDQGKREAKPWTGTEVYNPGTAAVSGKSKKASCKSQALK